MLACVARMEATCWREASARTCLSVLLRRVGGFQVVDLKGRWKRAMSRGSWTEGAGVEDGLMGAIIRETVVGVEEFF